MAPIEGCEGGPSREESDENDTKEDKQSTVEERQSDALTGMAANQAMSAAPTVPRISWTKLSASVPGQNRSATSPRDRFVHICPTPTRTRMPGRVE